MKEEMVKAEMSMQGRKLRHFSGAPGFLLTLLAFSSCWGLFTVETLSLFVMVTSSWQLTKWTDVSERSPWNGRGEASLSSALMAASCKKTEILFCWWYDTIVSGPHMTLCFEETNLWQQSTWLVAECQLQMPVFIFTWHCSAVKNSSLLQRMHSGQAIRKY